MKLLLGNFATRIGSSKIITARNSDHALGAIQELSNAIFLKIGPPPTPS